MFLSAVVQSCPVDFAFGQGLSYSQISYSRLRWRTGAGSQPWSVPGARIAVGGRFEVSLDVSNHGLRNANHTVLLYFIQAYRRVTPEANNLLAFQRVYVGAGQTTTVEFSLHTSDLSYVGVDFDRVVETGKYTLALGHPQYGVPTSSQCEETQTCSQMELYHEECNHNQTGGLCSVSMTQLNSMEHQEDPDANQGETESDSEESTSQLVESRCYYDVTTIVAAFMCGILVGGGITWFLRAPKDVQDVEERPTHTLIGCGDAEIVIQGGASRFHNEM